MIVPATIVIIPEGSTAGKVMNEAVVDWEKHELEKLNEFFHSQTGSIEYRC
jgi:hypothetical protein